jgi:hypothetical protein
MTRPPSLHSFPRTISEGVRFFVFPLVQCSHAHGPCSSPPPRYRKRRPTAPYNTPRSHARWFRTTLVPHPSTDLRETTASSRRLRRPSIPCRSHAVVQSTMTSRRKRSRSRAQVSPPACPSITLTSRRSISFAPLRLQRPRKSARERTRIHSPCP